MRRLTFQERNAEPEEAKTATGVAAATESARVSVIVPCRNEEDRIGTFLEAVRRQDAPVHEVIVADGGSTDATSVIVRTYRERHPDLRLEWMPVRGVGISEAMNRAIRAAAGDVIIRLDGHSLPRPDYVRRAVETLAETGAGVVGGVWTIASGGAGRISEAIALAVGHPMGAGDAAYRTFSADRGQTDVDTVPFGCFLKSSWERLGGFNEALLANEDYEFNYRMRASGSRVVLDPAIECTYFARKTFGELAGQYFRYGWWKGQMLRAHPRSLRWRQAVPALLIPAAGFLAILAVMWSPARAALGGLLALYLIAIAAAAVRISAREGRWDLPGPLIAAFAIVHWCWGAGVLVNVITFGRWPSWRPAVPPATAGEGQRGFSGTSLLLALSCIFVLAMVVPPGLATLVNRTRIDRAQVQVAELAVQLGQAWARGDSAAMTAADVLASEGSMPAAPEGSGWAAGRTAVLGEHVPAAPEADPWGNRYLVNVGAAKLPASTSDLKVRSTGEIGLWVLSAGPNGIIETPFAAPRSSASLGGDDIGARISGSESR